MCCPKHSLWYLGYKQGFLKLNTNKFGINVLSHPRGQFPKQLSDMFSCEVLGTVEAYWSTDYQLSKPKSIASEPPFYVSKGKIKFDRWVASWTRHLIHRSSGPQCLLFKGYSRLSRSRTRISLFLLPYLIQDVALYGTKADINDILSEIRLALQVLPHFCFVNC